MKLLDALKSITDEYNIESAEEYVVVSLTVEEWRTIRDYVEGAHLPITTDALPCGHASGIYTENGKDYCDWCGEPVRR